MRIRIINIFIHNDTSDILELVEKKYLQNGNLSLIDCDENSLNCSSIISYKVHNCIGDNGSCGRGLLIYPPGSNNTTEGKFPDKIFCCVSSSPSRKVSGFGNLRLIHQQSFFTKYV